MTRHALSLALLAALAACSGPDGGDRGGAPAARTVEAPPPARPAAAEPGQSAPAPVSRIGALQRQAAESERPRGGGNLAGGAGRSQVRSPFSSRR